MTANFERLFVVFYADGRVHAAQEKLHVLGAFNLQQWHELMNHQASLALGLVVELVGHVSEVISDALAHGDDDWLALVAHVIFTYDVIKKEK